MVSLTDDNYLSKVESELANMLKGDGVEFLSSFEGDTDLSDLDALESEFSELSEFITETDEITEQDTKVNALIDVLEKAQDLVSALRGEPGSDEENDDAIQTRLDQVESAVNQAHELLSRLENEVKEIRQTVSSNHA